MIATPATTQSAPNANRTLERWRSRRFPVKIAVMGSPCDQKPSPDGVVRLRPAVDDDREFLFALYGTTRAQELDAWGWAPAQRDAFLKMQFEAQARSYRAQYPAAEHSIIVRDELPVGHMIVASGGDELRLVDIALMPQYQRLGIAGGLIRALMQRASSENLVLRLSVLASNTAAIRLYQRLGMQRTAGDELYWRMEWSPAG